MEERNRELAHIQSQILQRFYFLTSFYYYKIVTGCLKGVYILDSGIAG